MARFSLDLRELETTNALGTLGVVPETQWPSTQAIMQNLSTDSEVTFRRVLGSTEILPTRPGVDPLEVTKPMPDLSDISQSPMTAKVRLSSRVRSLGHCLLWRRMFSALGRRFGQHQTDPRQTLHLYTIIMRTNNVPSTDVMGV